MQQPSLDKSTAAVAKLINSEIDKIGIDKEEKITGTDNCHHHKQKHWGAYAEHRKQTRCGR